MPFRHEDVSAFGPKELEILHEVFDLAWHRVLANGLDGAGHQDARRRLAQCIMAHAKPGKLDVPFLLERCIAQFNEAKRPKPTA
jgi:hypothetical protein